MDKIITMNHVKKIFDKVTALEDINCSVMRGEIFGLLGPSGAGKTTIINILTGQMSMTEGQARIFDVSTKHLMDRHYAKIGMMLEDSGIYKRLSVHDNLLIFAEIYGVPKSRISDVLKKVGLIDSAKKQVEKLSKGMMQRLILARSILNQPEILFLDEPTSGLDPATASGIHEFLFSLRDQGTTIFLTTHNMEEADRLCDHIALLNTGRIVEYGTPKELCHRHQTNKSIRILLNDAEVMLLPNEKASAAKIAALFENNSVMSIHSSEPNLEAVFMKLTGRKLS